MSDGYAYPRRLIEVDLPIKQISAHARREKSIRHGHISTLHNWWARRPLAACRAITCAAIWLDPADAACPQPFRDSAEKALKQLAQHFVATRKGSEELAADLIKSLRGSNKKKKQAAQLEAERRHEYWKKVAQADELSPDEIRAGLLELIAWASGWEQSTLPAMLETVRELTRAAHEASGGMPSTKPLVVDPFAGGGAIPLEALRAGADAFASDLNPVTVLLNKVVLEYTPRYGQKLTNKVQEWGRWVGEQAEKELAEFYPQDPDGATPLAYLWARTISCEGPGCGAEIPLLRSLWLSKKEGRSVALRMVPKPQEKRVDFEIFHNAKARDVAGGTTRQGSATCPVCGYTTSVKAVRKQLKPRHGGTADARLFAVVTSKPAQSGRFYRLPDSRDLQAASEARAELERQKQEHVGQFSLVPDESTAHYHSFVNRGPIYGMTTWEDYCTPRQALALATFARLVRAAGETLAVEFDAGLASAVQTCLALAVDRQANTLSSLSHWHLTRENIEGAFSQQALKMVWDFVEANPLSGATGDWEGAVQWIQKVCSANSAAELEPGQAIAASATAHPLPDDLAQAFITDPPYYFSVQYADLSDFFYVWLRRSLAERHPDLLSLPETPKEDEIIVQSPGHEFATEGKNRTFYESRMRVAMEEGRRILSPSGVGVIVFAHTSTAGWEALLKALVEAGWTVTGSWPIDTEMAARVQAQNRAVLASSVHIVCRPRENADGVVRTDDVGDWRDVLQELPERIQEWMPRLAQEGVVGADSIFACLGPALEVFSRYSRVEKASGEKVELPEYMEHVWAAVAREALSLILEDADASGFEEDARLTAIWFWVLKAAQGNGVSSTPPPSEEEQRDEPSEDTEASAQKKASGYPMEYDAARKLAQGLGADLNKLNRPGGIISIQGKTVTLNGIASRERLLIGQQLSLFGEEPDVYARRVVRETENTTATLRSIRDRTPRLFDQPFKPQNDISQPSLLLPDASDAYSLMERLLNGGSTVLDRLHQAMLLFGRSQTSLIGPLLNETGMGTDQRFWRLAQALSALYPANSDEKRWVDGVLARKKGLGF